MDRRDMLTYVGAAVGTASLGGCLSEYRNVAGEAGETTNEEPADTTTEESTEATEATETTAPASVASTSFEVTDSGCGQPTNEASVTFREAESAVGVTGTIAGSNACYTAALADASYDAATGTLTLTVVSKQKEDAGVCADCITEIDYEATVGFEGGLPATVEVVHEGVDGTETVTTAESG